MRKILVTGGAGYIGTEVCRAIEKSGMKPIIADIDNGRDLRYWSPQGVLIENEIDTVIHLAAYTSNPLSFAEALGYFHNNIVSTINLLSSMKRGDRIIFASSAAVYGAPLFDRPICEHDMTSPLSPYAQSKLFCEEIIRSACKQLGIEYVILRLFNVAGNKNPNCEALIPQVIRSLLNQKPINVYGDDYETTDGTAIRDFVHVEEVALSFINAIDIVNCNAIFNIGSGDGHSVNQVIDMAEKITGLKAVINFMPRRLGDIASICADISYAKEAIGLRELRDDLYYIIDTEYQYQRRPIK